MQWQKRDSNIHKNISSGYKSISTCLSQKGTKEKRKLSRQHARAKERECNETEFLFPWACARARNSYREKKKRLPTDCRDTETEPKQRQRSCWNRNYAHENTLCIREYTLRTAVLTSHNLVHRHGKSTQRKQKHGHFLPPSIWSPNCQTIASAVFTAPACNGRVWCGYFVAL